jgi:hypothetical protein
MNASMQDRFLSTTRVQGPIDPSTVTKDVVIEKKITFRKVALAGATAIDNTDLSAQLPNVVGSVRLQKLSVYGEAVDNGFIEVTDVTSDLASFRDYGTTGSIRPQVHIAPSLAVRQRFVGIGSGVVLYRLATVATGSVVVVATVEVRLSVTSTA